MTFSRLAPGNQEIVQGVRLRRVLPGSWEVLRDDLYFYLESSDPRGDEAELCRVRDRHGNEIRCLRDADGLRELIDAAGRRLVLRRERGRIVEVVIVVGSEQWRVASFVYDDDGDLRRAVDADGFHFEYDYLDHRMIRQRRPDGVVYRYRYANDGRCIETWGEDPIGTGRWLDQDARRAGPEPHADSRARFLWCRFARDADGYTEVSDSVGAQKFSGTPDGRIEKAVARGVTERRFDDRGFPVAEVRPSGAATTWRRDDYGRIIERTDPLGATTRVERNVDGDVLRITGPEGIVAEFERDARGNIETATDPSGSVASFQYDSRGLLTGFCDRTGARWELGYDGHGNLVHVVAPGARRWSFEYNALGQCTATVQPLGGRTVFKWSVRGDLLERASQYGVTRYEWDGERRPTAQHSADGTSGRLVWAGPGRLCDIQKPDGTTVEL